MNCPEAQPFISALHDGEIVPQEAAAHIGSCSSCKARLSEYAQMGAELRLLASAGTDQSAAPLPALPPPVRRWTQSLTARVLVPRFALGLGALLIVALSLSLGVVRAQVGGLWFQFEVTSPDGNGSWGNEVQTGYRGEPAVISIVRPSGGPRETLASIIDVDEVQSRLVRLSVRARRFEAASAGPQARSEVTVGSSMSMPEIRHALENTPSRQYDYIPGQTLEIPLEGGGKLLLTGRVLERRASLWIKEDEQLRPKPDEIVLNEPALVRDNELLIKGVGSASANGGDPYVAMFVPKEGLFAFLLKPIPGAVAAQAEYGRASFKLEGRDYVLFAATPISGGQQPRGIWVFHDPQYVPSGPGAVATIGSGSDFETQVERTDK